MQVQEEREKVALRLNIQKNKIMASTPELLPGKSQDGGAWWATVHGVAQSQT